MQINNKCFLNLCWIQQTKDIKSRNLGAGEDFEETTSPDQGPGTIDLRRLYCILKALNADPDMYLSPSKSPSEVEISGGGIAAFCQGPRGIVDSLHIGREKKHKPLTRLLNYYLDVKNPGGC